MGHRLLIDHGLSNLLTTSCCYCLWPHAGDNTIASTTAAYHYHHYSYYYYYYDDDV